MSEPRYLSQAEVIKAFGDPISLILPDGGISPQWESHILRSVDLMTPLPLDWLPNVERRRLRCHRRIVPFIKAVMDTIQGSEELAPLLVDFGGDYQWRRQRGASVISRHSWGIAFDFNPSQNPQGKPPHPDMHLLADVFEAQGFYWGGRFKGKRVDGMHFEFGDLALLEEWHGVSSGSSTTAPERIVP